MYFENSRFFALNLVATVPIALVIHMVLGQSVGAYRLLLRRWGGLSASWFGGFVFAVGVYEVVHLSSHLPRHGQPEWLWLWSSAHRLHHRDPTANFGFHDSTWDWAFGTLASGSSSIMT